jgi:hypothetical protein
MVLTTVTVTNAEGKVIYSKTGEKTAGVHDFEWNGELNGGGIAAKDKPYYISVVSENAEHNAITPVHSLVTTISGVDLTYGEPALTTPAASKLAAAPFRPCAARRSDSALGVGTSGCKAAKNPTHTTLSRGLTMSILAMLAGAPEPNSAR